MTQAYTIDMMCIQYDCYMDWNNFVTSECLMLNTLSERSCVLLLCVGISMPVISCYSIHTAADSFVSLKETEFESRHSTAGSSRSDFATVIAVSLPPRESRVLPRAILAAHTSS